MRRFSVCHAKPGWFVRTSTSSWNTWSPASVCSTTMERVESPMIQCSIEDGNLGLTGSSTIVTLASSASTSSTVEWFATTQSGNSKAATFMAPSRGASAYTA